MSDPLYMLRCPGRSYPARCTAILATSRDSAILLLYRCLRQNKTIKLLRRNHRWSRMIQDVKQYIRNCYICRRFKTARDKYNELLNSLSMFDRSWTDIIFDFVTKLSDSRDYNAILMIVNRLSKMHHYISCTIDENEITIEKIVKLFIQNVWKLHELLTTMISNRNSQFISFV
jgi:hypothetical protein